MNSKLSKKLKNYTLVAGAVISATSTMNSQIIYKNIDDVILDKTSGSYNLDLDGCGQTDFSLQIVSSSNINASSSDFYHSALITPENSNYIHTVNSLVKALSSGEDLSTNMVFKNINLLQLYSLSVSRTISTTTSTTTIMTTTTSTTTTTNGGTNQITHMNTITNTFTNTFTNTISSTSLTGNFGGAGDKFIGVEFDINGNTHLGWIRVNVNSDASQMIIKDYAYEATPLTTIKAGEIPNSTTAVSIPTVTDISDYGNGFDLQINFNKIPDESQASGYRIFVVPQGDCFNLGIASNIAPSDYTEVALTGADQTVRLTATTNDILGNKITASTSYNIYIQTIADGTNKNGDALSEPSNLFSLSDNISAGAVSNITVSDISDNNNGSDLQVGFNRIADENLASEYKIMVVKSADAATFDLAASDTVTNFTVVNTGTSGTLTLTTDAKDINGDLIKNGTAYKVFVLTVADGTNASKNSLSEASSEIILTTPAEAVTGLTVSDVSDNNNGSDLQVDFNRIADESLASEYRIMVVKSADAATFDLAAADTVSNFTVVNTGTSGTLTLATDAKDINGDLIKNGTAYKVFVLTVADGTNADVNALSDASSEITLVDTSTDIKNLFTNKLHISPNPTQGILKINSKNLTNCKIDVFNVTGKIIYSSIISQEKTIIDISDNPSGIYLIRIYNNSDSYTGKVILKKQSY
ncbi:MAG: T9SS type A sorting domain-containing protein [Chlorobi bacterium]|nr:T9SS type A sorting domain-containing protein [Chlorobiota bacterium]